MGNPSLHTEYIDECRYQYMWSDLRLFVEVVDSIAGS